MTDKSKEKLEQFLHAILVVEPFPGVVVHVRNKYNTWGIIGRSW